MDKHLLGQRTRLCASGRRNWKAIEGCGGADRKEDDASHRSFLCARPSGERQHMAGECGKLPPPPPLEVSGRVSRSDAWSARMADKVPGSKRHYPHRHRLRSPLGDTFFVSRVLHWSIQIESSHASPSFEKAGTKKGSQKAKKPCFWSFSCKIKVFFRCFAELYTRSCAHVDKDTNTHHGTIKEAESKATLDGFQASKEEPSGEEYILSTVEHIPCSLPLLFRIVV
ncbi:hypothetical protein BHE74_00046701 [Ensete ventricosum]|nr:hypothetical protein BHE74_00046701 [Ensete ventricosum]